LAKYALKHVSLSPERGATCTFCRGIWVPHRYITTSGEDRPKEFSCDEMIILQAILCYFSWYWEKVRMRILVSDIDKERMDFPLYRSNDPVIIRIK
jgi:hypothetical protein